MIVPEDIMYQDDDICILKPEVKKGILIFTNYKKPDGIESLRDIGLKTGAQLHKEGIQFDRIIYHPYIFFRAPYLCNPIDYTSINTEIISSFGQDLYGEPDSSSTKLLGIQPRVWIRIDPNNTNVYASEIRAIKYNIESEVNKSKKNMIEYLQIIAENKRIVSETDKKDFKPFYNLLNYRVKMFSKNTIPPYPWNKFNVNRHSEVLVRLPHLTPEYFVKCV